LVASLEILRQAMSSSNIIDILPTIQIDIPRLAEENVESRTHLGLGYPRGMGELFSFLGGVLVISNTTCMYTFQTVTAVHPPPL